ncbi:hypothetical protein CABS01_16619, partial [Colletotrichum abscissum]|uniref:uncharacterized protein n=1 Tax=Colletotrichum abscissum TaxID=1671311 RepID=UPI0027D59D1B
FSRRLGSTIPANTTPKIPGTTIEANSQCLGILTMAKRLRYPTLVHRKTTLRGNSVCRSLLGSSAPANCVHFQHHNERKAIAVSTGSRTLTTRSEMAYALHRLPWHAFAWRTR